MPTYGYRCQSCQCEFDVWQKMSDDPVAACPECGGRGRRLFFPAGIVFKGSGFYKTDSRSSSSSGSSSNGTSGAKSKSPTTSDSGSSSGSGSSPGSSSTTGTSSE